MKYILHTNRTNHPNQSLKRLIINNLKFELIIVLVGIGWGKVSFGWGVPVFGWYGWGVGVAFLATMGKQKVFFLLN